MWNRDAEWVFGYSAAEVVSTSLDVIIPERLRRAHWEGFRRAIDSGQTKYGNRVLTTRSVQKDGNKLYVDLSFGLVRDPAGAVVGALAIGRDCTARYLAEKTLRARIFELEQKVEVAKKGVRRRAFKTRALVSCFFAAAFRGIKEPSCSTNGEHS